MGLLDIQLRGMKLYLMGTEIVRLTGTPCWKKQNILNVKPQHLQIFKKKTGKEIPLLWQTRRTISANY